jgi:carboxymethylenebutenolidase
MPDIEFSTSAGSAPGYLAVPDGEHGPATIVMQEWWGVDDHIRSICDRLAAEGFYALAPDLYRGETASGPSEAEQKMMALSMSEAEKDMCGAADYLASLPGFEGPGVGAVGFCLGGGLAVWAAATCPNIAAAVTYYYVMPHGKPDFGGIGGPVLGHFGTADEFVPVDAAKELEAEIRGAGANVTFHFYEGGGHAFFNDTNRLGTYDAQLADASWERTVGFLRSALAS